MRLALTDKIVARKTKTETSNGTEASAPAKTTRRTKTPANRKKSVARARKTKSGATAPGSVELTDEEIRLRAYFIAERRHRFDLPGDADSDWLEAKRQLLSELTQK